MKTFIDWFLLRFGDPKPGIFTRAKFVEGTEWICPKCRESLAVALRDIHTGEMATSTAWAIPNDVYMPLKHCGMDTMRYDPDTGCHQIFTPTGWVG